MIGRLARGWWRDATFLTGASITGLVALAIWNALVPAAILLAILVVGLPASLLVAGLWRRLVDVDRRLVARYAGRPVTVLPQPSTAPVEGHRFAAFLRLLASPRTWLDLVWLAYHATAGLGLALTGLGLPLGATLYWAAYAAGARPELAKELADTDWAWVSEPRPVIVAGVLLTLLAVVGVPILARVHAAIGRVLLFDRGAAATATPADAGVAGGSDGGAQGPAADGADPAPTVPGPGGADGTPAGDGPFDPPHGAQTAAPAPDPDEDPGLRLARQLPSAGDLLAGHLAIVVAVSLLMTTVWVLDGAPRTVWPVWVWFAGGCTVGLHVLGLRAMVVPRLTLLRDALIGMSVATSAIWLFSGGGDYWPRWPIVAGWVVYGILRIGPLGEAWQRSALLRSRIDELTTTRREVVDTQAEELQRIERDLHDGAQARLVALSMQLGRAEARLADADRPEVELVAAARKEALAAIAELRDLARGIAPPILQARGLVAAVQALTERTPVAATVEGVVEPRPSAAIESCGYFVCAEALTNVAKHAAGATVRVSLQREGEQLRIVVRDDGPGGAVIAGGGLEGLRRRVAALDGRLQLESPAGGGTTVTVELPCAS